MFPFVPDAAPMAPPAQIAAPASRCDPVAYEAAIGNVEDQAFNALKAANAAVANAARSGGDVGTAGDADWRSYKALMARADQMRWSNAPALAACQTSTAKPTPAPAVNVPVQQAAVAAPLDTSPPEAGLRHLRMSITSGLGGGLDAKNSIPEFTVQGNYLFYSSTPVQSPIPGGFFEQTTAPVPTGQRFDLKTSEQDSQNHLSLTYAENGFDAPGAQFSFRIGEDIGTIKQTLTHSLSGGAATFGTNPSVNCLVVGIGPTGPFCSTFSYNYPFQQKLFAFNEQPVQTLSAVDVRQRYNTFDVGSEAARVFTVPTPIGPVDVIPAANMTATWWTFGSEVFYSGTGQGGTAVSGSVGAVHGEGPGFTATANLALRGQFVPNWPVRWRINAGAGAEGVDLLLLGGPNPTLSQSFARVRMVSNYGGEIEYDFWRDWGAIFSVERQQTAYLATEFSPGASGAPVSGGIFLNFETAYYDLFAVTLQHDF